MHGAFKYGFPLAYCRLTHCRDLLSIEGVARDFRSQLAGFVFPGSALLEGHPYSRRDLHHLYSSHSKVHLQKHRQRSQPALQMP